MTVHPVHDQPPEAPLRPPHQVMRLSRLGSFHQCRVSFMRILLRRIASGGWTFARPVFEIDAKGEGYALYTVNTGVRTYTLVAFAHDLPADKRTDRVIAEAWDATFALHDGVPTPEDVGRLRRNVPLQEAGRVSERELVLSRANRSARLFDSVVEALASGQQPDMEDLARVGYLMRTTAVYGSGKFGAADYETICDRPEFSAPFQAEMLTVFMIRRFVVDLVEHLAHVRAPDTAVVLSNSARRRLSIGNSTGLGMAPYLINHPVLLNNWILARERALARVRAVLKPDPQRFFEFCAHLDAAIANAEGWRSDHDGQIERLSELRQDLRVLRQQVREDGGKGHYFWNKIYEWAEHNLSVEAQEQLVSLLLEPFPDLVDDLADGMADHADGFVQIDACRKIGDIRKLVEVAYDWALGIDWADKVCTARAWYVSAEKQEPRLGERFDEPIADYEQPLAPGRDMARLYFALCAWDPARRLREMLLASPEHRLAVKRLHVVEQYPYAEIRDNTLDAAMMPIDMLRCKLSFFGAGRFDPRSDRWVRINMFQGAPYPGDDLVEYCDDWAYRA